MTDLLYPGRRAGMAARRLARLLACLAGAACVLAAPVSAAQAISKAEALLFQSDHLAHVAAPATLTYAFRKVSNIEPGFDDEVVLDVTRPRAGGTAAVSVRFLSGSRRHDTPALDSAQGNPALLGFLERDIAEMKRLTGGATNYFRKRIRLALAESAQVTARRFSYGGKEVDGQEVRIEPYRGDPLRDRFGKYAGKSYVFVVSEQVPGGLYQLRTSLPGAPAGGGDVMDETLTLARVARGKR